MRTFNSLEEWIAFLETELPAAVKAAAPVGLEDAALFLEATCKAALGHYQPGAGPFPAWEDLKDVTQILRSEHGYPADEPLLVTGDLRAHIEHSVDAAALHATVGVPSVWVGEHDSDDGDPHTRYRDIGQVALEQEFGLAGKPERSFLGLPAAANHDEIGRKMGAPVAHALAGEPVISKHDDEPPF